MDTCIMFGQIDAPEQKEKDGVKGMRRREKQEGLESGSFRDLKARVNDFIKVVLLK